MHAMVATSNELTTWDETRNPSDAGTSRSFSDTNLTLYYCILLRTSAQSTAGLFYSFCVHTIPFILFLMRASMKHNIEMTRLSSAFTSRVRDTLCCQSCLQICLSLLGPIVYFWKAHIGITLIGSRPRVLQTSKQRSRGAKRSHISHEPVDTRLSLLLLTIFWTKQTNCVVGSRYNAVIDGAFRWFVKYLPSCRSKYVQFWLEPYRCFEKSLCHFQVSDHCLHVICINVWEK